jgi:hypothetical protein
VAHIPSPAAAAGLVEPACAGFVWAEIAQDRITAIAEAAERLERFLDLELSLGQAHHDRKRAAGMFLAVSTMAQTD